MAIVYRIVQDHQGRITIDSKPGAGTSITVQLPAPGRIRSSAGATMKEDLDFRI